jgi:hypothetical protein
MPGAFPPASVRAGWWATMLSMGYAVVDRMGAYTRNAGLDEIDRVLSELDGPPDDEHPDVSLIHESEWCLGAFPSGLLVWENVDAHDTIGPRHMLAVPREKVRQLWLALAAGDLPSIEAEPWRPGYG